ncbi:MAG: ribonuclease III [Alphaproteobacteria bacterium]|jgi:ribonuclease-3|nr:ribonuclease III [Alphaproteobacteria bacterium]
MEELQDILQYKFNNERLLQQALTHSSMTGNEHRNYERLEFLGDRVLGMTMAHLLYKMFPHDREGVLAQRHVKLVCAEMVAEVARRLHLDKYIITKEKETAQSVNVLCDVGEAVIGAIYIDSNIEEAIAFVERNWRDMIDVDMGAQKDYKTRLQEKFHSMRLPSPVYEVVEKSGSEHLPVWRVKVALDEQTYAFGEGHNKKTAEQQAAAKLLETWQ